MTSSPDGSWLAAIWSFPSWVLSKTLYYLNLDSLNALSTTFLTSWPNILRFISTTFSNPPVFSCRRRLPLGMPAGRLFTITTVTLLALKCWTTFFFFFFALKLTHLQDWNLGSLVSYENTPQKMETEHSRHVLCFTWCFQFVTNSWCFLPKFLRRCKVMRMQISNLWPRASCVHSHYIAFHSTPSYGCWSCNASY